MPFSISNHAIGKLSEEEEAEYYLTFSSGGSTAFLASLGALLSCSAAGLNKFRMLGGVSAGAIASALTSTGLNAVDLLHLGLGLDFNEHLGLWHDLRRNWRRYFKSSKSPIYENEQEPIQRRCTGLLSTDRLGSFIENYATTGGTSPSIWPKAFWTMATTREGLAVLFKADGVYQISRSGLISKLSDTAVALSAAVRMSCSIPGIFAAMRYKGMYLFDGALTRDGFCPVGVQIRHFGTNPRKIIACNMGADILDPIGGPLHSFCRGSWGIDTQRSWGPETTGVIEFRPQINHVHALKLKPTRDEKWLAILISFESCSSRLALEGILKGENLCKVQSILRSLGNWRHTFPSKQGAPQVFSARAEACFAEHGLF